MADNLTSILKDISKRYGNTVAKIGADDLTVDGVLSLGEGRVNESKRSFICFKYI